MTSDGTPLDATLPEGRQASRTDVVATRSGRIAFVDNARAVGIVLVVVGHAPGFPQRLIDFIFAFHMPLFFLLSGLLVDEFRLRPSTWSRVRSLARSLLVPYAFYFVVAYLYWLVAKRHGLRASEMEALAWWDPLVGFVRGNGDGLYVDVVLWFFPCLFVTASLHHALRKVLDGTLTAIVLACGACLFIAWHEPAQSRWWWSADCAVVASAFFAAGSVLSRHVRHGVLDSPWPSKLSLAVVAGVACFALSTRTGYVNLNGLAFGLEPMLYLPTAVVGIVAMLALAASFRGSRIAVWLSTNTLVVFPLHFLVFSVVTGVALIVFRADPSFKDSPWAGPGYTIVALLACWPAGAAIRFAFPWVLASRGRSRHAASVAGRDAARTGA